MVKRTMTTDSADPARRLALLWGDRTRTTRKGKHDLSVAKIAATGIALADTAGVEALSMRKVAEALAVGTMSLYTYVPGKAELVEVMIDTVYADIAAGPVTPGPWRDRLTHVAGDAFAQYLKHPWLLQVPTDRAALGPGAAAKYERELSTIDGIGLSDIEMDAVVSLVGGQVESAARHAADAAASVSTTGVTEQEWWAAHAPLLARFADHTRFPLAARVGTTAGQAHGGITAADGGFAFGLARIIDGVAAFIDSRP